jgi:hypothetical protein
VSRVVSVLCQNTLHVEFIEEVEGSSISRNEWCAGRLIYSRKSPLAKFGSRQLFCNFKKLGHGSPHVDRHQAEIHLELTYHNQRSIMPKCPVYEHHASYASIANKHPHGLRLLKALFLEYDNSIPNRDRLEQLFSADFTDNENDSARNIGREEAIDAIITSRRRVLKHQMDLKRAICIEHEGKSARHEVFFEGVRHMFFPVDEPSDPTSEEKGEWIRTPFAGRIEVKVKENRFQFKDPVIEIISRKWTVDNSALVKRDMMRRSMTAASKSNVNLPVTPSMTNLGPASPVSPQESVSVSDRIERHDTGNSQIGIGGLTELPAAISSLAVHDGKPPSYKSGASAAGVQRSNTVNTMESSIQGESTFDVGTLQSR